MGRWDGENFRWKVRVKRVCEKGRVRLVERKESLRWERNMVLQNVRGLVIRRNAPTKNGEQCGFGTDHSIGQTNWWYGGAVGKRERDVIYGLDRVMNNLRSVEGE